MRPRILLLLLALTTLPSRAGALPVFSEDFSDNSAGWTLGTEWQIGPAMTSSGHTGGTFPDPAADHSPSADNGVAGTIIGGNITTAIHAPYALTSPLINLSSVPGSVSLTFWRWLNLDYPSFMTGRVEVSSNGGATWTTLWSSPAGVAMADSAWTLQTFDVTAHKSASFRVRFTHQVGSGGAFTVSGWNVDDVALETSCSDDLDGDGFISTSCGGPDCDDANPAIHPGATEICNGLDDNCSGFADEGLLTVYFRDADGDGYGFDGDAVQACAPPAGYVLPYGDCDDANAAVHPGATEACNGVDDDCSGQADDGLEFLWYFRDADGDGYGNDGEYLSACAPPPGYSLVGGDCNDSDFAVNPGATETCNGLDDNCDLVVDEGVGTPHYMDQDQDGHGNPYVISYVCDGQEPPAGYVLPGDDCNDLDPAIHPGNAETCDGFDNDCDGVTDDFCNYLTIQSIRDVSGDQGRQVRIRWIRSVNDSITGPDRTETYSVWRRLDSAGAVTNRTAPAEAEGIGGLKIHTLPPGNWDFITMVPAIREQHYQLVAPTLCDSNAAGFCRSTFLIRAHSASGGFVDAPLDSGYSVDNLVPGVPQNLVANPVAGGRQLDWSDSPDSDFQYFRVYRDANPDFVPGPANLVHSTAASAWTDPTLASYAYKVTAVDANGNESAPASTTLLVAVEEGAGAALAFASVAPNPFRGEVACAITVPAGGTRVELRVHDLAGRVVKTLASGGITPGRHSWTWDGRDGTGRRVAPGIYLLRLSGAGVTTVRRIAFTP